MKGFRGRALFNLLQIRYKNQPLPSSVEPWQMEDYEKIPLKELFASLKKLKLPLNEQTFLEGAQDKENPEVLLQYFAGDFDVKSKLQIYLIVFELWKRLLPTLRPISILCDALDHEITKLRELETADSEHLQDLLLAMQDLFDQAVDDGYIPEKVFVMVNSYLAHNLESVLYGYIKHQFDAQNDTEASEWIDGFYRYIPSKLSFDFLKFRLLFTHDMHDAIKLIDPLIDRILEANARRVALDLLEFLSQYGSADLFMNTFKKMVSLIQTEKDFIDMLNIAGDFYQGLDKEFEESQIRELVASRKDIEPSRKIEIERLLLHIFTKKVSAKN